MNINEFFDSLNAKNWRKNMKIEASIKLDQWLANLNEHKDEFIDQITDLIVSMETLKMEDNELFEYDQFKKWLNHFTCRVIIEHLEKLNES